MSNQSDRMSVGKRFAVVGAITGAIAVYALPSYFGAVLPALVTGDMENLTFLVLTILFGVVPFVVLWSSITCIVAFIVWISTGRNVLYSLWMFPVKMVDGFLGWANNGMPTNFTMTRQSERAERERLSILEAEHFAAEIKPYLEELDREFPGATE